MYIRVQTYRTLGESVGPFEGTFTGTPILAHTLPMAVWGHGASAVAISEANKSMIEVLGSLGRDNVNLLEGMDVQLHIVPHDKKLTDLDEFAWLKGVKTFDGSNYDDVRGVGGTKFGKSILYAVAEETLVSIPGRKPSGECRGHVVSHESGHVVAQFALTKTQTRRLQEAYNTRKDANGPWLRPYASSNCQEYFGDATAAFFEHAISNREADKVAYTRAWLKKNDRPIYRLLTDVYKTPPA